MASSTASFLSSDAVRMIVSGMEIEKPELQVFDIKSWTPQIKNKFKCKVSDGVHCMAALFMDESTNKLVATSQIAQGSVLRVLEYSTSAKKNAKGVDDDVFMHIELAEVMRPGLHDLVGTPFLVKKSDVCAPQPVRNPPAKNVSLVPVYEIAQLKPECGDKWKITCCVARKPDVRKFAAKGGYDSKLANVTLQNAAGDQIQATMFGKSVDKWHDRLEKGQWYSVQSGAIKAANAQYNKTGHAYEITFNEKTLIEPIASPNDQAATSLARITKILDIPSADHTRSQSVVSVVGCVIAVQPLENVTIKSTGRLCEKRVITIQDDTAAVDVTFWGKSARDFAATERKTLILLTDCTVDVYRASVTLKATGNSECSSSASNCEDYVRLAKWIDSPSSSFELDNISNGAGKSSSSSSDGGVRKRIRSPYDDSVKRILIEDMAQVVDASTNSGENHFSIKAYINSIQWSMDNPPWYMACPKCRSKVEVSSSSSSSVFASNQQPLYCNKCKEEVPANQSVPRYKLTVELVDKSGSQRVTCFDQAAESLVCVSALAAKAIAEDNEKDFEAYHAIGNAVQGRVKVFLITLAPNTNIGNSSGAFQCNAVLACDIDSKLECELLKKVPLI